MMSDNSKLYDEILRSGPSQTTVRIILTRIKDEGRANEAVKGCMKFLRDFPDDIYLRMLLAECYFEMGLQGQAEAEFLKVTSMIKDLTPAYARLAGMYAAQKRFEEAADAAGVFLAYYPDDLEFRELLKKVEQARDAAKGKGEAQDPAWPVLLDDEAGALIDFATPTIAELYFSQGQLDAALATYEKVLEEHPDDIASFERLSQLKTEQEARLSRVTAESTNLRALEEKMLTILEKWLPMMGEIKNG